MKSASRSGQGGPAQVKITAATEDDLPVIVSILNYSAASSIAHFDTRPASVAERRDWFGHFSATGPYRLVVARRGDQVTPASASRAHVGSSDIQPSSADDRPSVKVTADPAPPRMRRFIRA
jgi:hypothetical protein